MRRFHRTKWLKAEQVKLPVRPMLTIQYIMTLKYWNACIYTCKHP